MQKSIHRIFDTIGHLLSGRKVSDDHREEARSRWGELRGIFVVLASAADHHQRGLPETVGVMLHSTIARLANFDDDTSHRLPAIEPAEYKVDPDRLDMVQERVLPSTGIYVRAKMGGSFGSYDSMTLDGPSFAAWVQSRGPIPQFVLDLLVHAYRHDPFEEPGTDELEGG